MRSASRSAAACATAALLLGAIPAASEAQSKVSLRWQGHTVRAHPGQPRECPRSKRARQRLLPVRTGAWLTVIAYGPWRAISVQLGRVSPRRYRALGPVLGTLHRPHGRWRVTIGSVRHANVLSVEAVGEEGARARFYVCVTR